MTNPYPDPLTDSYRLEDGGAAVTATRYGQIAGAVYAFDTGAGPVEWGGVLVFDVSALTAGGGRSYTLKAVASNTADLSTGVVELAGPLPIAAAGQQAVFVSNKVITTVYRYVGIQVIPAGTSPSITLTAWLIATSQFPGFSQAQIIGLLGLAAARFEDASKAFRAWTGGVVGGGPDSDGKYPLYDGAGVSYLIACPAQMAHDSAAAFSVATITGADLLDESGNDPELDSPDVLIAYDPAAAAGGPTLFKAPFAMFAARRTRDLHDYTLGDNNLANLNISVTDPSTNLDRKMALKQLMRVTTGIVDPTLPPYNCRFDAHFTRSVSSASGSHTLEAAEDVWRDDDVGKKIGLSNAGASGFPLWTTIATYVGPREITITAAASTDFSFNDCAWGTDDTTGMQAALDAVEGVPSYDYGGVVQLPSGRRALVGSLKFRPRSGLFGKGVRQSGFIRYDDGAMYTTEFSGSQPAPTLWNESRDADFVALGDFAINGARFLQTKSYPGLVYWTRTGGEAMPQVDPYPMFTRMHVFNAGWDGIEFRNRHSGTCAFVEVINCGGVGFNMACYDANIINILSISHDGPALMVQGQGANNNFINAKCSFSGVNFQWLLGAWLGATNVYVQGGGNNFENMRVQESYGSNIAISGSGNNFTGTQADDTGCIFPNHGISDGSLPQVRAAVLMVAGAKNNRLNDLGYGPAVHIGTNYATHGIYFAGDGNPAHDITTTQGRMFTKDMGGGYYGSETGDFTPGAVGFTGMSAIDASNATVEIDGTPVV